MLFSNAWEGTIARAVVGEGRRAVTVVVLVQGDDLILTIRGGRAHVGAVAVAVPGAGVADEPFRALTVVPGHREGPLAAEGAAQVAAATGRTCVAVAGIHQDAATPEEIEAIVRHAREAIARAVAELALSKES